MRERSSVEIAGKARRSRVGLAAAILSLMFITAACSGSGSESEPAGTDEAGAAEAGTTAKPYELVMAYPSFGDVSDAASVQEAISALTLEKMNATVKLVPISVANYQDQMNLMLAGSEKLDVVYTSVWRGFASQVSRGQIVPLDDLIAQYGQGIGQYVPEEIAEAGKVKGETYGIPSVKAWALTPSFVMRKDLVDKHGIEVSQLKTWADIGPVLEIIKTKEPGVTPIVNYNIGEAIGSGMLFLDPLGMGSGVLDFDGTGYQILDGTESEDYNDMLKLVREWFLAGYMSKDVATVQESGGTLLKAGSAFSFIRNINDCYTESVSAGVELVCVGLDPTYMTRNSVSSNMISIARNSGNPEAAMQFINLLYTDAEIINLFTNGIEGKHYVKGENGLIRKPDGTTSTGYDSNQFAVGNNFLSAVWEGNAPDIWEQMKKLNESAVKSRALGFSFDMEPVKAEMAAVSNVQNQFNAGFLTGTTDPSELPSFIEKLKAAGRDAVIAEKQKQLDAWLATQ